MKLAVFRWLWLLVPALVLVGSCFAEPGPHQVLPSNRDGGGGGADASDGQQIVLGCPPDLAARTAPPEAQCRSANTSEPLPARRIVSDENAAKADVRFLTDDLFASFKSNCGVCHVAESRGGFNVTRVSFSTKIDQKVLDAIRSDDPGVFMPPPSWGGKPWSARVQGDPVRELVARIELWMNAGRPDDSFIIPASEGGKAPFFMDAALAQSLTNLGTCVPDAALVSTAQEKGCQIDARFAAMKKALASEAGKPLEEYLGLPKRLEETDLFTFDSAELARHGVIGFAPAYPLWSDSAGKLRHVRVPFGQSIRFNKEKQEFEIPKNTRFYKTFLKKVTDDAGNERWKKIETRLIVSRPGEDPLFGVYEWNEPETEAKLLTEPYRDVTPFSDKVITVVTNEPLAAEIRKKVDDGDLFNWTYEMERQGGLRRYAMPGRDRCIQCHMGSPSASFVLGFTPLQIWRRPQGEGGVIEPTGPDELTQLDRLIQYGVITGISSSADIVPLERSQEPRKPRNEHELFAQSYMLGNCAHCHNPQGFPSVQFPELKPLLDFWPNNGGGIFEFPLEAYSPRIKRGIDGEVQVPYITPSIRDRIPETRRVGAKWTPKHYVQAAGGGGIYRVQYLDAPWRSLLWRNVDSPFTYSDEAAIFPHMPRNTPGFDCRAPRILGDWMISIPAVRKHPELDENRPTDAEIIAVGASIPLLIDPIDRTPQPYQEIKPGEPGYENAKADTQKRFDRWRGGSRYSFCPDTSDIVDPTVVRGLRVVPEDNEIPEFEIDAVPDRPHWVETDLTEIPPPWAPRRDDWQKILVEHEFPELDPRARDYEEQKKRQDAEKKLVEILGARTLTPALRELALEEVPFGLWAKKPSCDFSGVPQVKDFPVENRPGWMAATGADEPVFMTAPGEAVYDMICINCHGVQADSKGVQADTVADLTGGKARVANFKTGLFGGESPGGNRQRVFLEQAGVSGEDWAARYLGWMALGGTRAPIPGPVLQAVARTEVLGKPRTGFEIEASPNMLAVAQELCRRILPIDNNEEPFSQDGVSKVWRFPDLQKKDPLIEGNGDAELWQRLCFHENPIVRVMEVKRLAVGGLKLVLPPDSFARVDHYGNEPVVDHRGKRVIGVRPKENLFPWCIRKPAENSQALADAQEFIQLNRTADNQELPFCPNATITTDLLKREDTEAWAVRGAMNAGFSVFLFLNELAHGRVDRTRYNECEKLKP